MHITKKGQVTIPQAIRKKFGFLPNTEIEFVIKNNQVIVKKAKRSGKKKSPLQRLIGKADTSLSTEQIMALTRND